MNIQDFVRETLVQITKGVIQAQEDVHDTGALINPQMLDIGPEHSIGTASMRLGQIVGKVEFDVAVRATEGKETKGGIGVVAGVVSLGSAGKSDKTTGSESRIKFSIPIALPPMPVKVFKAELPKAHKP